MHIVNRVSPPVRLLHHNAMPHTVGGHIAFCTGTTLGDTQTKTQRLEPHWNHTNRDLAHCNDTHSGTFFTGTTLGDTQTKTHTQTQRLEPHWVTHKQRETWHIARLLNWAHCNHVPLKALAGRLDLYLALKSFGHRVAH